MTLAAFFARSSFQSEPAVPRAMSAKNAHSGWDSPPSSAVSRAAAYSLNVGACPLLQNSRATILAVAPSRNFLC